jgi:hypothetical protein
LDDFPIDDTPDPQPTPGGHTTLSDSDLLERARRAENGAQFVALFDNGNINGYPSQSEADLSLCCHFAFWSNRDAEQIDRLFRASALFRQDKWQARKDYAARTVNKAIELTTTVYQPKSNGRHIETGDDRAQLEAIQEERQVAKKRAPQPEPQAASLPADSFLATYVRYAGMRTDAPLAAHELMGAGVLSALAGPTPRIPLAAYINNMPLALWTMYLVNSTVGRKSSTVDYAADLLFEVLGTEAVILWEGSPQAILQRLAARDGQSAVFIRDEYSGLLHQMNRGGHMAGLPQTFIKAFDCAPLENNRTKKRNKATGQLENDTDRVQCPYMAKLCASTWDAFVNRSSIDNVLDGFLARFLVVTGASTPRRMIKAGNEVRSARESLIIQAGLFREKASVTSQLEITDEVLEKAWQCELRLNAKAEETSRPDATGPALKRLCDSILKVSGLLAIDAAARGEIPAIQVCHFEQAWNIGQKWISGAIELIEAVGRSVSQRTCDELLQTLRAHPGGMKQRDLWRKHQRLCHREFMEALNTLQGQDRIMVTEGESKSGPAFHWVIATEETE